MSEFNPFGDEAYEFRRNKIDPGFAVAFSMFNPMPMTTTASAVSPNKDQLALGPGDRAIAMMTDALINQEVTLCQIEDPAEHEREFPDWQTRTFMGEWVLTSWISSDDYAHGTHLGWFERARMLPITADQYTETEGYFAVWDTEEESQLPGWIEKLFEDYTAQVAERFPDQVAKKITCEHCGKTNISIHGSKLSKFRADAGIKVIDGKETYVNTESPDFENTQEIHLHCEDCDARMPLDGDEYHIE